MGGLPTLPPQFYEVVLASLRNNFMLAWLIIGIAHIFFYTERIRLRENEILKLQSNLAEAKLAALSAQINPHFLFNALNSVAELMHCDADKADQMLVSLSSLLRRSLSEKLEQEVTLREEQELIADYVEIEKVRLGERLNVNWKIGSACLDAFVPTFVLQPIVENAIVHSVSQKTEPGLIRITAIKDKDCLTLSVQDDGSLDHHRVSGHGIGLRNIRERLQYLYGEQGASITLLNNGTLGMLVEIRLPFNLEPVSSIGSTAGKPNQFNQGLLKP